MSFPTILGNAITSAMGLNWNTEIIDTNSGYSQQVIAGYDTLNGGGAIPIYTVQVAGIYRCSAWGIIQSTLTGPGPPYPLRPWMVFVQTGLTVPYVKYFAPEVYDDATAVTLDMTVTVQCAQNDVVFFYLVDNTAEGGPYFKWSGLGYPNTFSLFSVERVG